LAHGPAILGVLIDGRVGGGGWWVSLNHFQLQLRKKESQMKLPKNKAKRLYFFK